MSDLTLSPAPTIGSLAPFVNTQAGASYTGVSADRNALVRMNNAGANTFTIPPNSSVPYPVPAVIYVEQAGAGATTIAGGAGVTVNGVGGSLTIGAQFATVTLLQVAADTWVVTGIPFNTAATGPLTGTTLDYRTLTLHSPNGLYSSTILVSDLAHLTFAQDTMRFNSAGGTQYMQLDGNAANVFTPLVTVPVHVSQLPAAGAGNYGGRMFVDDALTTLVLGLGTTVAAGGANKVPVYSDAVTWKYG
ncbi:MAG: hypothetical protein ABJF10_21255 [Chthoniobacter sp.]|uniref:hypothetical protein n=1 Tax=Chthoniobacter sp. TaxID=2510640 RepID=UPI0032A19896